MGTGNKFAMNCYKLRKLLLCYIHFIARYYCFCSGKIEFTGILKHHTNEILYCDHCDTFLDLPNIFQGKLAEIKKTQPCEVIRGPLNLFSIFFGQRTIY